jgi:hypothetical protein
MEGADAPVILSFMATFMARSSSDWALNSSGVDFSVISTGFGFGVSMPALIASPVHPCAT